MTISTPASQTTVLGNNSLTVFSFNFVYDTGSDLAVTYTDANGVQTLLSPSQYLLFLNPAATGQLWGVGGTVTYPLSGSPIANGTSLTIQRLLPLTQTTSISNQGDFYPQVVEQELDTLCMQIQQVSGKTGQLRGVWQTGIQYNYGDIVQDGINGANTSNYYFCVLPGISGVWATDLASGDWALGIDVATFQGYVVSAAASAASASSSASSASVSAASASSSAVASASSATAAATSASNASTSAGTASTAATSAGNSAISSSNSATSASNSASTAATQASVATAQASSATASATAASASAVLAASTFTGTSTTSNTIGTGSFTFITQTNKGFVPGQPIIAASGNNSVSGSVTSYNASTGSLVINATTSSGSGTFTSWSISVIGTPGANGSGTGTVTSVSVTTQNGVSATVSNSTTTPTLAFTLAAITPTSVASSGVISSVGVGSSTLADAATQPGIFSGGSSPTAGNMIGIAITKSGFEEAFFGINKSTTTGSVPASAVYISTYTATGQISIGRGNTAGAPNTSDILINGSGNVSIPNALAVTGVITATGGVTGNLTGIASSATALVAQAANTIVANATTGSAAPTAIAIAASRIIGRDNTGNITGLTVSSDLTLSSGALGVNTGTSASQIVKLDGSAHLPAIDGSALTNLTATNLGTGTVPTARLASGTASSTTFLRGDQTWASATAPTTAGGVGTYMMGNSSSGSILAFGTTVAGSTLTPTASNGAGVTNAQTGTWQCMGYSRASSSDVTIYLRIA